MSQTVKWVTDGRGASEMRRIRMDLRSPGATEVVMKVEALSLNYRDLLVINGVGTWRPSSPVTPISDAAGEIISVGSEVTRFAVGDRVMPVFLPEWRVGPLTAEQYVRPTGGPVNAGFLAEHVVIDQQELVAAPCSLTVEQSATLPVAGVTAWHALKRAEVAPGDVVLIHGTGGVSLMATRLALALGAVVVLTSSSTAKLRRAHALGVQHLIDYRRQDVAEEVRRLTAGRGADAVIETVGGDNLNVSLSAVRIGGRISFVGLLDGVDGNVRTYDLVTRNVTLHGIETGSREMLEDLVQFIDDHSVKPVVDKVMPRAAVAEALEYLASGQHFGKVVLS